MTPHRGILVNRIPAEGAGGLIFALGLASLVVLAVPALRPFALASVALGVLAAPLLHRLHAH